LRYFPVSNAPEPPRKILFPGGELEGKVWRAISIVTSKGNKTLPKNRADLANRDLMDCVRILFRKPPD